MQVEQVGKHRDRAGLASRAGTAFLEAEAPGPGEAEGGGDVEAVGAGLARGEPFGPLAAKVRCANRRLTTKNASTAIGIKAPGVMPSAKRLTARPVIAIANSRIGAIRKPAFWRQAAAAAMIPPVRKKAHMSARSTAIPGMRNTALSDGTRPTSTRRTPAARTAWS